MRTKNSLGFTLVETIITMIIMAVLTTFAARTIQQAFRAKAKIEDQIDTVSQVKDTLRMFERDVNLAYHYTDLELELAQELDKAQAAKPTATPNPNPDRDRDVDEGGVGGGGAPSPPKTSYVQALKTENRQDPTTQFIGKESELHFVTTNVVRYMKNSPQADFGEVSYFLESCKNRPDKSFESGKCLFRRTSPFVDKDVTKGGTATQLLPDVTEFKLKYYSKIQKDWRKDWNSKADGGEANTQDRYPEALEVSLLVEPPMKGPEAKGKKKKISIQMVIPVHNPNNKEPSNSKEPNAKAP